MVLAGLVLTGFASWIYALLAPMTAPLGRRLGAIGFSGVMVIAWFQTMVDFDARAVKQSSQESGSGVLTEEGNINWAGLALSGSSLKVSVDDQCLWITPQIGVRTARRTRKSSSRLNRFRRPSKTPISCLMKADLTNDNEVIWEWLAKLGRSAIPAYVVYMPDGSIDLPPEVITKDMVLKSLSAAAEKYPRDAYTSMAAACAEL